MKCFRCRKIVGVNDKFCIHCGAKLNDTYSDYRANNNHNNKGGLLDTLVKVTSVLANINSKMEQNEKSQLEEEMDAYGLEEFEKELVRKGEYNPWDFETEGPFEDDDYYNEDV